MPTVKELRRFAGADPCESDESLRTYLEAAAAWYKAAGVPPREGDALYAYWVLNLAAWFHDNRGLDSDKSLPRYIVESVHQLRAPAGLEGET